MLYRCRAIALLSLGFMLLPLPAHAGEKSAKHAWPAAFAAHYSLRFNGIEVGRLKLKSNTSETAYSLSGSAKVSVLFGAYKFSGSSSVSGTVQEDALAPQTYQFSWHRDKKLKRAIEIAFEDRNDNGSWDPGEPEPAAWNRQVALDGLPGVTLAGTRVFPPHVRVRHSQ